MKHGVIVVAIETVLQKILTRLWNLRRYNRKFSFHV